MTRPFVFAIDVEPDEREIPADQRKAWSGFELGFELLADLRRRLRERTAREVHFSWFVRLDPQIEAAYGDPTWPLRHRGRTQADVQTRFRPRCCRSTTSCT